MTASQNLLPVKNDLFIASDSWVFSALVRTTLTVLIATTMANAFPRGAWAGNKTARIGNSYEFQLKGNPSTGYKWVLNRPASTGANVVRVKALGYGKPNSRKLGAPAPFFFRVTCIETGFAKLRFDYVSPGSASTVSKSHTHEARCE